MAEEKKEDSHEPSAARRRNLREAESNSSSIPTVSNFFPLERYYDASDKVLQSFEAAYERKSLDEAYVFGIRFCDFCVKGIVKHDYYRSSKFAARKLQTNQRVDMVLKKLEQVAAWMDKEEIERAARYEAFLKRQREEHAKKQKELEAKRMASIELRLAKQAAEFSKFHHSQTKSENVEESAMAKLQRLAQSSSSTSSLPSTIPMPMPPPSDGTTTGLTKREPDGQIFSTTDSEEGSLPPPMLPPTPGQYDDDYDPISRSVLPTPMMVPPPSSSSDRPPSYQDIIAQQSYFGPGMVVGRPTTTTTTTTLSSSGSNGHPSAPSYDSIGNLSGPKPMAQKPTLSLRQYISRASHRYREYQQKGKILVSPLGTYQGRVSGTTNGCTVISACVVSKHLEGRGVTDSEIQTVIDRDCIPLLSAIRSKLGLGGGSLIIPSDVHDYMVDHKLLHQHKFVGAAGGNICDQNHVQEVYKMLQGEQQKTQHLKAGATLFFREHVVSIVKFPISPTEAVYDLVDSLASANGRASRTRCNSIESLKVLLEWYTSHKFSDSNIGYMEKNKWDDAMADFDPRVFQAFVWADLPKPR